MHSISSAARIIQRPFAGVAAAGIILLCFGCDKSPTSTETDQQTKTSPSAAPASTTAAQSPGARPVTHASVVVTSDKPLVFSPTTQFEGIEAGVNATLSRSADGLLVRASTNDPMLGLPRLETVRGTKVRVHIQLVSAAATTLEVFYNTFSNPEFDAQHSIRKPIQAGANDITVDLVDPNFGGRIRVDPGELAGDYTIKLIEITALSGNSPSESISPGATP